MADKEEPITAATEHEQTHDQKVAAPHLLSMAPELRNRIYNLVFQGDTKEKVDLLNAQPPSKALLLTCRAIKREASLLYKHTYRRYWSSTAFQITASILKTTAAAAARLSQLSDQDCNNITNIEIVLTLQSGGIAWRTWHISYLGNSTWWLGSKPAGTERFHSESYTRWQEPLDSGQALESTIERTQDNLNARVRKLAPYRPASMKKMVHRYLKGS